MEKRQIEDEMNYFLDSFEKLCRQYRMYVSPDGLIVHNLGKGRLRTDDFNDVIIESLDAIYENTGKEGLV